MAAASAADATPKPRRLFLATNYEENRWCAFGSEAAAVAMTERGMGLTSADVTVADGKITKMTVYWGPQSYDWAVTDTYALRGTETQSVSRYIGYTDLHPRPARQWFDRKNGQLVLIRTVAGSGIITDYPPYADVSQAPFYRLALRAASKSLPASGLCETRPTPRAPP